MKLNSTTEMMVLLYWLKQLYTYVNNYLLMHPAFFCLREKKLLCGSVEISILGTANIDATYFCVYMHYDDTIFKHRKAINHIFSTTRHVSCPTTISRG